MPDATPQFFTPDSQGNSQELYKTLTDNLESLVSSSIKARNRQVKTLPSSTLMLDGIPGIPFERSAPNPDVFYQGEDIVYDVVLIHEGKPVTPDDYDIVAVVKTGPRSGKTTFILRPDSGIFQVVGEPGRFELWIPATQTESLFAGIYVVDIQITERVSEGVGRFDRRYVMLQQYFNIEYSNFSPNPESANSNSTLQRSDIESVWPNNPDTVGKRAIPKDELFYSTE